MKKQKIKTSLFLKATLFKNGKRVKGYSSHYKIKFHKKIIAIQMPEMADKVYLRVEYGDGKCNESNHYNANTLELAFKSYTEQAQTNFVNN